MKKFLPLIFATLLLAGCSSQGSTKMTDDQLFQKKQECAKYRDEIKEEFKNRDSAFTEDPQLQEVFYSPSKNSCLKAYTLIGGLTERVVVYAIDDILTTTNIWQKSTGGTGDFDAFEQEIKKLKGE